MAWLELISRRTQHEMAGFVSGTAMGSRGDVKALKKETKRLFEEGQ